MVDSKEEELTTMPGQLRGRVAEWFKALVLGTSHFDGVGSNPTPAIFFPTRATHAHLTRKSVLLSSVLLSPSLLTRPYFLLPPFLS